MTSPTICPACGADAVISREQFTGNAGVAQCQACSAVLVVSAWIPRVCDHCGLGWGISMHDPCLGELPGIAAACCGHGDSSKAYRIPRPV